MEYQVGDILRIDGELYKVLGKIQYRNTEDNCRWMEYRLKKLEGGDEFWLSVDEAYDEFSLSHAVKHTPLDGYHQVDSGTEEVLAVWGRVDVSVGDKAPFTEYEDETEEKIISEENWDDGKEVSVGFYLDWNEISVEKDPEIQKTAKKEKKPAIGKIFLILFGLILGIALISTLFGKKNSVSDYLKNHPEAYTYVTSITGNDKEKADVYRSSETMDLTAKDILEGIKGQTDDVQQNTEDGDESIAILTDEEYCLIYTSEDNEVLVQISSRKYAYTSDQTPYHARVHTHHYYRSYYYTRGYYNDSQRFRSTSSSYKNYDGGTVDSNFSDPYDNYSSSIRQSSVGSRTSSGGGLSSGK